jgi:hypothetical protein
MDKINKLKRAVIKEEYIALTNDVTKALILDRFMTLTYETLEMDKLIADETQRASTIGININMPLSYGWVFKKSEDLANEIMIASSKTIRNKLSELIADKYIYEKTSLIYRLEKTKMYKVNIDKIRKALEELDYTYETVINM